MLTREDDIDVHALRRQGGRSPRSSPWPWRSPPGRELLALHDHPARRWEPKRLRLRLFTVPATLARTGRQVLLHLADKAPWAHLAGQGITRLRALAAPG